MTERQDKLTSLGKQADGIELKVIDAKGNEVCSAGYGYGWKMALRGDMQMAGYYNMPEMTSETLVDGWLYTNDVVYTR